MVQIIAGEKGKGKTKYLLAMANETMAAAHGTVAFIDKNSKHMFELDRRIRLINAFEYPVAHSAEVFLGFLCGIIAQDHDLESVFLDGFLKLTNLEEMEEITAVIQKIRELGDRYDVNFVISLSRDKSELPDSLARLVTVAL